VWVVNFGWLTLRRLASIGFVGSAGVTGATITSITAVFSVLIGFSLLMVAIIADRRVRDSGRAKAAEKADQALLDAYAKGRADERDQRHEIDAAIARSRRVTRDYPPGDDDDDQSP
jgi:uncharacterized membrane protein